MPIISKAKTIDLADLSWGYNSSNNRFDGPRIADAAPVAPDVVAKAESKYYSIVSFGSLYNGADKSIAFDGLYIRLRDTDYTDVTSFKQYLRDNKVMLTYETVDTVEEGIISKYKKYNQLLTDASNIEWHYVATLSGPEQINTKLFAIKEGNNYAVLYYYKNMPVQNTEFAIFQIYDSIGRITYNSEFDKNIRGNGIWNGLFKARKDSIRIEARFRANGGIPYDCYLTRMVVDLTEIYGAGNEPETIAQFLSDYPEYNSYVPYTTGSLLLVDHIDEASIDNGQYVDIEEVIS